MGKIVFIGSGFNPNSVTSRTLSMWYRGDDVTTSGSDVTSWNDKSGNARHLNSILNTPQLVTGSLNNRDIIRCTDDSLNTASFSISFPFHCYMVVKMDSWSAQDMIIRIDGSGGDRGFVWQNGSSPQIVMNSSSVAASPTLSTWYLIDMYFDSTGFIRLNNGSKNSGAVSDMAATGTVLRLAEDSIVGREPADISYADVAIYQGGEVTGSDHTNLVSYFNNRYAL